MIADVCMLTCTVCYIVDLSGFVEEMKVRAGYTGHLKPWDCSACMTFWTVLLYLCCRYGVRIETVFLPAAASWSASLVTTALGLLKESIIYLLQLVDKKLQ